MEDRAGLRTKALPVSPSGEPSPAPPAPRPPLPHTGAAVRSPATGAQVHSLTARLDRRYHGLQGKLTLGVSPIALATPAVDWLVHIANAPFRRLELTLDAGVRCLRLWGDDTVAPAPGDHRFTDPQWNLPPFKFLERAFLLAQEWTEKATTCLPGVDPESERIVNFTARQVLDAVAPPNVPAFNPEFLRTTWQQQGRNLIAGYKNFLEDLAAGLHGPEDLPVGLRPGTDLAVTPGKVILRNELIELIQYAPTTGEVRPEPLLIVPAWIMKYYILDLSVHNSMIRYLVGQGYTVFCMSWRNPDASLRDTPFDDYRSRGFLAALDAVGTVCGDAKVHACGYCLGGTLLAIAAADMARDGDDRLATVTLFAAQTDFTEAGELQLFTTEEQVSFLEDVMAGPGYLEGRQMGGAFQILRSRDLIWSRLVRRYWLGEQDHPSDLMAWNEDVTRMPARMHSEYLRRMFLRNDLAEGRYEVDGAPISVADIHAPFFVVGTETDHVAPWRSVYKLHLLNPGDITFVLTSGGHNAGIVSEPGHPRRHFRVHRRRPGDHFLGPDAWAGEASLEDGSWWPVWASWLGERSGPPQPPPPIGSREHPALADAPGQYIMER